MQIIKILPLGIILMFKSGCAMWPYKSDFDCQIPKGERCKSLYEINQLADQGKYSPDQINPITCAIHKGRGEEV